MRPIWLQVAALALGIVLAVSCSGGGGGSSSVSPSVPPPVSAPSDLTAEYSFANSQGRFTFSWTPSPETVDGYEFEGRSEAYEFEKLHDGLLPPDWTGAYLDETVPELKDFAFRIRAQRALEYSTYSNEAHCRSSLNAPDITAFTAYSGGIRVNMFNRSLVADTLFLERGARPYGGSSYSWTSLPGVIFGDTHFQDHAAMSDMTEYAYRVTYSKGADRVSTTSSSVFIAAAGPSNLVATSLQADVKLTWQNNSLRTDRLVVLRGAGMDDYPIFQEIAQLSVVATTYDDLNVAPGFYTYRIEARGPGLAASSSHAKVAILPPAGDIGLKPQIFDLPKSMTLARATTGAWFLSGENWDDVAVRIPTATGWSDYRPAQADRCPPPSLVLDAQDKPHTVYLRRTLLDDPYWSIVHAWFDGFDWQTEEIARRSLYQTSANLPLTYALDASGNLKIVWLKDGTDGSASSLEYAQKAEDGIWKVESLDVVTPAISYLGNFRLVLDPAGSPHVVLGAWVGVYHLFRNPEGSWSWETVPIDSMGGRNDCLAGLFTDADHFTVFFERLRIPADGTDLACVTRTTEGWGAVEVLNDHFSDSALNFRATRAPSGQRMAIACEVGQGDLLMIWTNGTWRSSLTGTSPYGISHLGFDQDEKVILLKRAGSGPDGYFPYVQFSETP